MGTSDGDVGAFDRLAPIYDLLVPFSNANRIRAGLAYADREVDLVLDVAGGTGRVARGLSRSTVVVDAAANMLTRAARTGLPVVRGDATRLPVRSARVDAVTIVDALHHVADRAGAIGEGARVLRPGGVLVVKEFDPATLHGRVLAFGERLVGFDSQFAEPTALATLLEDAGLEATLVDAGFGYTMVGVKSNEGGERDAGDE